MSSLIEPKVLKGFRDFLPDQELRRRAIEARLARTFESFGFVPIDTPIIEYTEVLLGKGGGETDKQIYRFNDHGNRDVSLRYDLTVPFARFMAAHVSELYLPFKRYHMAKVFRGENTQRGRYREFTQCDFDIVGVDSAASDFEILETMYRSFQALEVGEVTIRLSHRGLFNRLLASLGVESATAEVLRIVDKLAKVGEEKVRTMLSEILSDEAVAKVLEFIQPEEEFLPTLEKMEELAGGPGEDSDRVRAIYSLIQGTGLAASFRLDPSITRGLDYYTGIVYETFLNALPDIGSVCSGGRYNNLASLYTKQELPGVGSSIGLDRLTAALDEIGEAAATEVPVKVLILMQDEQLAAHYCKIAARLRESDLNCEVYPEAKKLAAQFSYAEKKRIPIGIICGEDEYSRGTLNVRDLRSRESFNDLSIDAGIEQIRKLL